MMYPRTGVVLLLLAAGFGLTATSILDGGGPIVWAIIFGLAAVESVVAGLVALGLSDGP